MKLGVVTRSFPHLTNAGTAELLAEHGFSCTELCFSQTDSPYWVYNGRDDLSDLSDDRARKIVDTYRDSGIEVVSLGVFTNLLEPDEDERAANLAYFERYMELASSTGVGCVSTECGFIPSRRGVQADTYESAFDRLKESIWVLAKRGDALGVDIAVEPCVLDVIPSAKRMRDFIEQIGSPRVRVLLDPANLIANSSEEDMYRYLEKHVAYFHGKDRKVNDARGRAVGEGDIDWRRFLNLHREHTPDLPLIFEYVTADNFVEVRDRLLGYLGGAKASRSPRSATR